MRAARKKFYIFIMALVALCLCACAPSREELAENGIYTVEYSDALLAENIERAALSGETQFELNYYGRAGNLPDLAALDWQTGYVNNRFINIVNAEYEQYRGYVTADYTLDIADADELATLPRDNDGIAILDFSSEALEQGLLNMLDTKREKSIFVYNNPGDIQSFDKAVYDAVAEIQDRSYACEYMTERLSWVVTDYDGIAELEMTAQYRENVLPLGELKRVATRAELVDVVSDAWNAQERRIVLLLDGLETPDGTLMALLNEAESNCSDVPCEAEQIWTEQYREQDGKRILRVWAEYAVEDGELDGMWQELHESIAQTANAILSEGSSTDRELYRAAFDAVRHAARYDMSLYDATIEENMDADTRVARTAYGALINGKTVCTGYARAYKALCDELGLACRIVTGEQDGVGHAWNAVPIDGVVRYVDCSFADTGGGSDYFMFSPKFMNNAGYEMSEYSVTDW